VQKQIAAFVGNKSANEDQSVVAREAGHVPEHCVVVRIPDDERMPPDCIGHRFANRDVCNARKKRSLDPVVPGDFAARVLQPGLMDN